MSRPVVKFSTKDQPEFFAVLRKRVNQHFKDKNISKEANTEMKIKTVFMVSLYFTPLLLMLTGVVTTLWPIMAMWFMMGFGMAGIGLSIMHDANHGAYSKKQWVNNSMGFLINFLGANAPNWRIQHNVLHHSFTNIDNFDEDIKNPVMRFTPDQDRKPIFRFQAFYAPFFYSIMTLYWFVSKDFERLKRYKDKQLLGTQGLTYGKALAQAIFHKVWYTGLTIVLPIMILDIAWWQTMLGFVLMHAVTGLCLAFIFQPAHVIEETSFYNVDETGSVENNWAIHQLKTTANFATEAKVFSWFVGGLNHQVEHHLFPKICHVHYKHISKIVEQTAKEFGVPYLQHKTFYGALKSHFSVLHALGNGSYDLKLAKVKA